MSSQTLLVRSICVVVFVGWLMVWILSPTNTYQYTWSPNLKTRLYSTYFREQGTNLLLFTFPMMFIAALSCIFLHLHHKKTEHLQPKRGGVISGALRYLKRPAVVMGSPIGIVTALDLCFAAMFCALFIWSLFSYLKAGFAHLQKFTPTEKLWEQKFHCVALTVALVGNICWAFLFFPVTRGSSLLPLLGLTSESCIKYHMCLANLSNILFAAHSIACFIFWTLLSEPIQIVKWGKTHVSNQAGVIAAIIAAVMWVTSISRIRRKMFEVFFYTHQLYILYVLFYAIHVGVECLCTIAPGIFLFFIDRHLRFLHSQQRAMLLSARLLPCATVELNFANTPGLYYNPTSIVFINVPSISKLQWHPFTVTSSCNMESDKLSVAIKSQGNWSRDLNHLLSSNPKLDRLQVSVEGPYGPSTCHFLRHEQLVLVSGGSGIAPFISIIRELIFRINNQNDVVPRVLLICAFKTSSDLALLDLIVPHSASPSTAQISQLQLQIQAYVTRQKEEQEPQSRSNGTIMHFKPNDPVSDSPISPVLGPNNWLWLAAIISSSFVMFLLLLGIITRYYIYPVENESDGAYNWTFKVLWFVFVGCAAIWMCSSVVFLWCKRQNVSESKKLWNVEGPTLAESPEVDESIPHQFLVQATNVFYGSRPDFKKILSEEVKGDDVGVLVCGPRKMRNEVASLCSTASANNLHFEAISFSW